MDPDLSAFARPFVWGVSDCCLSVADCLVAMGHPDPMAPYRGRYDNARSAARLFAAHGGLEAAMGTQMALCGYVACASGGIVGLVSTALGPTACLRVGPYWYAKSRAGAFGYDDAQILRRWRI
jgi:hypothetical protein